MKRALRTYFMLTLICSVFLFACAKKRPVLYPNYHLQNVRNEQAQADIDECIRFAEDHGVTSSAEEKELTPVSSPLLVGSI
jgi:hypothetical protein